MSRVIFINRYFYPDHSATSQILGDLAFKLASEGHEVHVLTSRQIYDQPDARLAPEEWIDGVAIHRVQTTRYGRSNLAGRVVDYLSFYLSIGQKLAALTGPGDIVVAKTDPPLTSLPAAAIARRRGAHLVNWLQDLYPEVAIELGVPFLSGRAGAAMKLTRNWSLRVASANVVLGNAMAERLRDCGVETARIHVIPNWTDDRTLQPVPVESNPLRTSWKLNGKFVIGYSGNLGRAHEFETVLAAAVELRNECDIVFLCIGGGRQFAELGRRVETERLDAAFRFIPYQDRAILQHSLGVPDVHLDFDASLSRGAHLPKQILRNRSRGATGDRVDRQPWRNRRSRPYTRDRCGD